MIVENVSIFIKLALGDTPKQSNSESSHLQTSSAEIAGYQHNTAAQCSMIEITVPLTLPVRKVVLGNATGNAPSWLDDQFSRLPQIVAARRTVAAEAAMTLLQQQQQDELRRQRETWVRGLDDLRSATGRTNS